MVRKFITQIRYSVLIAGIVLGLSGIAQVQVATTSSGNIDDTDKWAWGTNVGWNNFRPEYGGVTVYCCDHLEGYAPGGKISAGSGWAATPAAGRTLTATPRIPTTV